MFGVRVHEIRQDISAINLNAELAEILQAKEGDPALLMKRFYFDINNKLIQSSLSYYPGDRYTQSSRFRATTSNSN
jgi:DNA-binding GntR family transcriptional regulator